MVLYYYDSTTGPSAFLATVAADQWAKLQALTGLQ